MLAPSALGFVNSQGKTWDFITIFQYCRSLLLFIVHFIFKMCVLGDIVTFCVFYFFFSF